MKITNIYNNRNFGNFRSDEYNVFFNAFEIIKTKFLNNDPTGEYSEFCFEYEVLEKLYKKYQEMPDKKIKLSKFMAYEFSNIIYQERDIKISTKNNIKSFLEIAFEERNTYIQNKMEYVTCKFFCNENNLVENKFKNILMKAGYYNTEFKFMPSRLSIDNKKVLIDNYFMPNNRLTKNYKIIDVTRKENFYILWEYQFLRNMMLKHYAPCEKDTNMYKNRYRRPSSYNMLVRRLTNLVYILSSYCLSYYEQYLDSDGAEDDETNRFSLCDDAQMMYIETLHCSLMGKYLKYEDFKHNEDSVVRLVNFNIENSKIKNENDLKEIRQYLSHFLKYCDFYKKNFN